MLGLAKKASERAIVVISITGICRRAVECGYYKIDLSDEKIIYQYPSLRLDVR